MRVYLITILLGYFISLQAFSCAEFDRLISVLLREKDEVALAEYKAAGLAGKIKHADGSSINFTNLEVQKLIKNRMAFLRGNHKFHVPPRNLPGFPKAYKVKGKTPKKNGGGVRTRWKDKKGNI